MVSYWRLLRRFRKEKHREPNPDEKCLLYFLALSNNGVKVNLIELRWE